MREAEYNPTEKERTVIDVERLESWVIGLAVLSILAVGFLTWMNGGAVSPLESLETGAEASAGFGGPTEWSAPAEGAATEQEHGGHEGGNSDGWGRFTVGEFCRDEGVDLEVATARLAVYELALDADQRIRELADDSGYKPSEIVDILLGREPGAGCDDPDCEHGSEADSSDETP